MAFTCEHCCTKIENLSVVIGRHVILKKVNLHINCREIVAVIGPNGAGKTTLLRAMLGEIPHSGDFTFLVKGIHGRVPRIGYVPQKLHFDTDSPISVLDFMALSIRCRPVWLGVAPGTAKEARVLLERVSAAHLAHKRLGELSGGELQRVLLAAAMTRVPDLLLLDEPVSAVDVKGLGLFYGIVDDLRKEHDISIIMATHDLAGVASHADRIVLLNKTVIADGTPQEVLADKKLLETFQLTLWNISKLNMPPENGAAQHD